MKSGEPARHERDDSPQATRELPPVTLGASVRVMARTSLLLFVALVLSACGPAGRTRLGTERTETTIQAPAPSVASYTTTPPTEGALVRGGGDTDAVVAAVASAAGNRGVTLIGDPRLATL